MSLNVWLNVDEPVVRESSGIFIRVDGSTKEVSREEWDAMCPGHEPTIAEQATETCCVYSANITHNLGKMADRAGVYRALWRPEELGFTKASELIEPLTDGLAKLEADPDTFKLDNPANGWGDYGVLVRFTRNYLDACKSHPAATIEISR